VALPEAVTQDRDVMLAEDFVLGGEAAAQERRDAKDVEELGGDALPARVRRLPTFVADPQRRVADRRDPPPNVVVRFVSYSRTATIRSCSSKGSARRTTASTTEKIAVPAPMPSASTISATAVKVGDPLRDRMAVRRSSSMAC
jgi:hypothetical protein